MRQIRGSESLPHHGATRVVRVLLRKALAIDIIFLCQEHRVLLKDEQDYKRSTLIMKNRKVVKSQSQGKFVVRELLFLSSQLCFIDKIYTQSH